MAKTASLLPVIGKSHTEESRRLPPREHCKILSPVNDYVFKRLFTLHHNLLRDFLLSVISISGDTLESMEILNTEMSGERKTNKRCILDIRLRTGQGHYINVEMQVYNHKGFSSRMLLYAAMLYAAQAQASQKYSTLRRTINVFVVKFEYDKDGSEPVSCYRVLETTRYREMKGSLEILLCVYHE